jgi:formamidopyrimidine-DNA glycosylase
VSRDAFRSRIGRGSAPIKARLLDQGAIAGIGNLLADEILWRARLDPRRAAGELSLEELDRLRRELRAATRAAIRLGGAHTGDLIAHRTRGGRCPRCGTALERATVGGRTTFWCPVCQPPG